ncbi:hypothetical protein BESB_039490 [Besnoitia besnoiti]|uniref:Transmembrane protein n=1 Tax=Besnoitia besnoiti TaxID=94643 RepID=A0A2A9MM71_BESBE|nr:hypothetical protein BESB_039490 [Besnoitia besnoiti]PFH37491.1 hypothetical protein BESB_039490 [Besnoitia besnoiti]
MVANVVAGAVCCCSVPRPKTQAERRILLCGGLLNVLLPCGAGSLVAGCCLRDNQLINTGALQLALTLLLVGVLWSLVYGIMMILNALTSPISSAAPQDPPAGEIEAFSKKASLAHQRASASHPGASRQSPQAAEIAGRGEGAAGGSRCAGDELAPFKTRHSVGSTEERLDRAFAQLQTGRWRSLTAASSSVAVAISPRALRGSKAEEGGARACHEGDDAGQERDAARSPDATLRAQVIGARTLPPSLLEEGRGGEGGMPSQD